MTSSSPAPKLPLWIFLVTDALLLVAAGFIAKYGHRPLTQIETLSIVGCIIVGAIVGLAPLIIHYERQKNEVLDDRQRALEALARTVSSSAEQISIAASGLHEIADVAQKNLRHAEQLPHKLQEKIAEFQAQLANTNDAEKEELEKELEELRASESERLQSISDKIAKTTAEFSKLEAATQQHLTAANEAVSKLSFGTASAIGKAQAAAEQALGQARVEAARTIGDATGTATKAIETTKAAALTEIATQFDAGIARLKEATAQIGATLEKAPTTVATTTAVPPPALDNPPSEPPAADTDAPKIAEEPLSSPPKRPRKQRREEPAAEPAAKPDEVVAPAETTTPHPLEEPATIENVAEPAPTEAADPVAADPVAADPAPAAEPAPIAPEKIAEVAPVAPPTAEPFAPPAAAEPTEPEPPKRKRAPKKADDDQPGLGLGLEEPKANGDENGGGSGIVERVLTSDGATRLLVTAYIGIGNRLFIRGTGPGLSWDKGVPLQFVSIGKWRWETNDATAPVEFKLLKNDEQECASLGQLAIDPGYQHEVTAAFN